MHQVTPKKRLGQHFLKDRNIAGKIVASITHHQLPIVEVGPGTGVLTRILIEKGSIFKAVDVDKESIDYLTSEYPQHTNDLVWADILKGGFDYFQDQQMVVLGNFPYNISSQLFFKIIESRQRVTEVVCMVQKEVAERICSGPGSKTYGILSVLLQAYFTTEYLFTVSEKVFLPPPKVKSAVMRLTRNANESLGCNEQLFKQIVKKGFNQRRKTLRNSLNTYDLSALSPDILGKRPEQLPFKDFIYITNNVKLNA
jgi:16S rRNA (adenine1518-N6/adenine1519-N6)-dimethyltransferase